MAANNLTGKHYFLTSYEVLKAGKGLNKSNSNANKYAVKELRRQQFHVAPAT